MSSSTTSPSRGLRAKTSDFIRGVGYSVHGRQSQTDLSTLSATSMTLGVPSTSGDEGTKKKITRIPLFGRSRKKSNQSSSSSPYASTGTVRYSTEAGESSSTSRDPSTDRRPSEPVISVQPPPLPTPANRAHNSSLTSKFAAHFSQPRSSKPAVTQTESAKPAAQTSGLYPKATRSSSFESGSSVGTKSRSTTPRPAAERPTITVSFSPDDLDEYHDLFVRPQDLEPRSEPSVGIRRSKTIAGANSDAVVSSPSTSGKRSPEPIVYRRGQTPASAMAAALRHRQTPSNSSDRPPTPPQKTPKSPSEGSIPRASAARESPRPSANEMEKGIPPSLQRRTSVAVASITSEEGTPSTRSRMKAPSSPSRSRPPSIPLPLPPTPTLSSFSANAQIPSPTSSRHPRGDSISSFSSREGSVRPRAHTISSGFNSAASASRSRATTAKPTAVPPIVPASTEKNGFDIETASAEELRSALKERNLQYDELASFVLKMTEGHVSTVAQLEKKLSLLEAENAKQDKTIQGLIHIINEHSAQHQQPKQLPPSILGRARFASSAGSGAESDYDPPRGSRSAVPSRLNYHSDSGGESHATSGHESVRASSGTESLTSSIFNRNKKARRTYVPGESPYLAARSSTLLRASKLPPAVGPPETGLPDVPVANTKRASMGSGSVSPSSSTSSLLPPSPSITMSSLSAIPESPGLTPSLRPPRQGGTDSPEERRMAQAANRISMSSMASSSTAASSSYSSIKRSRPPSIAQVLEKSPNVGDVLDKLRHFS
ncbi:hypothetical protein HYPSUDRAFT_199855 [Hypholoma sublateritium FD-334 SS-4]|uniref:Uncharacterized protein n=1 Tax=Hypholoma sublateritium (strain FD-334 SS-4) TaxID=945553 RepID=A0A0D2P331_HYPSF|nr:hypothetical protein HYPSUDRAFT_199855 [Hypholoma sublateritium FD-334 SS-4]